MKKSIVFLISMAASHVFACDSLLANFPRDCAIQDRYTAVRAAYTSLNIDMNEVAEYRVLRFVDRSSWEKAKAAQTPVSQIYKPAPTTWDIWDKAIRNIFGTTSFKEVLFGDFSINVSTLKVVNKLLLTDGAKNITGSGADKSVMPGTIRSDNHKSVAFCSDGKTDQRALIDLVNESSVRFQKKWEAAMGLSLLAIVQKQFPDVKMVDTPAFDSQLSLGSAVCDKFNAKKEQVNYLPSGAVEENLRWFVAFTTANLQRFKEKNPALSPIEFATFAQKWLVSIHPFSDGNGRTTRAVQDAILANFDMPFAPAGDLQNDVTTDFETYLEMTYQKMEAMLSVLENCATKRAAGAVISYQCRTISEIF